MATQSLDKIIEWLKNDPLHRWEVYNIDQDSVIDKCLSYQELIDRYTSPMDYFKELLHQGVTNVQLQRKRKNGSSQRKIGCGLNYALSKSSKNNVDASGSTARPAATHQQFQGLGNPGTGLGFSETMDIYTKAHQFDTLSSQYEELKTEHRTLQDKLEKYKEDSIRHEIEKKSKPSVADTLIESLAKNPEMITGIIASLKPATTSGLHAPAPQKKLSDNKQYLTDMIAMDNVPDDLSNAASHIIAQGLAENKDFINDYLELLKKYELI
ncbi:hypothetical protein [Zunongwangia sp.]|uniref:hypothetical protein n=1 Tax=Zunongwangia sp. TaxID=1965325 RepID=UPI003AA8DADE